MKSASDSYSVKNSIKMMIIIIILGTYFPCNGAEEISDSVIYKIETNATFSGGENTPFWLVSNKFGLGSPQFNNGFVRGGIEKQISSEKRFSWGAGIDLVGEWNIPGPFRIQQLYGEIKYRELSLSIGSREIISQYNDRYLSSGDLLFSTNSLPIPQLRAGTYDFAPFWGTNGWFSVRGYLAYGMFTDSKWKKKWVAKNTLRTSNVLFCSRGLWLRGGNFEKFPLTFDIGIEMGTQFGGIIYSENGRIDMPTKFIDWLKAIIPLTGSAATPEEEQTNVQGNMTGEYSMSTHFAPSKDWDIRVYWEHYFEDHSQMTFQYGLWKDGLWGVEINFPKNKFISKFVFEYIATKDQTGAVNHDYTPEIPEQVSGGDSYFNHYLYGAWQNWGMSIGTPLAISPLYNHNHFLKIYDTRFIASHFGMEGNPIKELKWRFLLTFSRNWGTYRFPFPDVYNNTSGLLEVSCTHKSLKGWYAKGAIAWDYGKLLGNNFGGVVSIGYRGDFSLSR